MLTDAQIDGFADRAFADYMRDKNDDSDRAFARAVEAAATAEARALVGQMLRALEKSDYQARAERHHAISAARAFLGEAQEPMSDFRTLPVGEAKGDGHAL